MVSLLSCLSFSVFADDYSDQYPSSYNSGSQVWINCNVLNYGNYLIILPSNTNIYSFGFSGSTGYNLINNSSGTISGRAYSLNGSSSYECRFQSFGTLEFRVPSGTYYTWTSVTISSITGTTLCPIDNNGTRGNDRLMWHYYAEQYWYIAVLVFVAVIAGIYVFKAVKRGF